ncbi:MAG: peptidoglycan-binding protein, partial [Alphaproteobacteria bacterium]|nr:peptidoglycan-binding protein [Alphaproteobacteria bacterium]
MPNIKPKIEPKIEPKIDMTAENYCFAPAVKIGAYRAFSVAICALLLSSPFVMARAAMAEQLPENRTASFFSRLMPHAGEELPAAIPVLPAVQTSAEKPQAAQLPALPKPILITLIESGKIDGVRVTQAEDLKRFYSERNGTYLWVKNGTYSSDVKKIYQLMTQSAAHGLNPQNYHIEQIASRLNARFADETQAAEAELIISDAVARLGGDLTGMRVNPASIKADRNSWSMGAAAYSLLNMMAESNDPESLLEKLPPQDDTYRALQKELAALTEQAAEEQKSPLPKLPAKIKTLKPGQQSPVVGLLRARLDPQSIVVSDVYDEDLQEKVMAFQLDHGLKNDGVVGPRTVSALNEGVREKLIKVLANLE